MTSVDESDCLILVTDEMHADLQPINALAPLSLVPGSDDGTSSADDTDFDPTKKWVRITGVQRNQLIEFDFSVGEPELYIELVLPFRAFQEFCANNQVRHLSAEQAAAVDYDRLKWRSGTPGIDHE